MNTDFAQSLKGWGRLSAEDCCRAKGRHRGIHFNSPHNVDPFPHFSGKIYNEYFALVAERLASRESSSVSARKFVEYDQKHARANREISQLRLIVAKQAAAIAVLQGEIFPPSAPRDEYATWVESKDADKYAGMYVAFVPGHGPIDSAKTIRELRSKIKGHELLKKVSIVSVPNAAR